MGRKCAQTRATATAKPNSKSDPGDFSWSVRLELESEVGMQLPFTE